MAQWVVRLPSSEVLLHSGVTAHTCGPSAAQEAEAGVAEAQGHPQLGCLRGDRRSGGGEVKVRAVICSRFAVQGHKQNKTKENRHSELWGRVAFFSVSEALVPMLPPFLGILPTGFHLPFSAFTVPSAPS